MRPIVRALVFVALGAFALETRARADDDAPADDAAMTEARAHHQRGLELYDEGDYALALVELDRAYELSKSYRVLYNIGQVSYQLRSWARARRAFEQYLALGGDRVDAQRRADVERDLASLAERTATLTVRASVPGADVRVNDAPLGKAPIDGAIVDAGELHVEVTAPGYAFALRDVTLVGGDVRTIDVALVASAGPARPVDVSLAPSPGLPPIAVAGWIVTGVLTMGAVGTGIGASAASSVYDSKRGTPISGSPIEARADLGRQRDLVRGLAATTDALALAAVVAAGVSLYFTLRDRPRAHAPVTAFAPLRFEL